MLWMTRSQHWTSACAALISASLIWSLLVEEIYAHDCAFGLQRCEFPRGRRTFLGLHAIRARAAAVGLRRLLVGEFPKPRQCQKGQTRPFHPLGEDGTIRYGQ